MDAIEVSGLGCQHRTSGGGVNRHAAAHAHPEHGYRACLGLKRLAKQYGSERLAAACQRALAIHGASYTSVHSILKNRLDQVPAVVDPPANEVPLLHPNLRGTIYYQQPLLDA